MSVAVDHYLLKLSEIDRTIVESLRFIVKSSHSEIIESLKYGVPFYNLGRPMCYISIRKDGVVYIGFMNGKKMESRFGVLKSEKLKRVAHFDIPTIDYLIDNEDLVREVINEAVLLNQ